MQLQVIPWTKWTNGRSFGSIPNLWKEPYSNVFFIIGTEDSSTIYKLQKLTVFTFWTLPLTLCLSSSFFMRLLFIKLVCKEQNNLFSTVPSSTRHFLTEASNGHISGVGLICDRAKYGRKLTSCKLNSKYPKKWQLKQLCSTSEHSERDS